MRESSTGVCANCGAKLHGEYCAVCGQKRVVDADRRIGNLLREFFEAATDLDGRFWRTIGALLLQPGRLSLDHIEGRRARWMSPVALFLLVNLVYFVFAPHSDFATPFAWEVPGRVALESRDPGSVTPEDAARLRADPGPFHARFTAPLVDHRVEARSAEADGARGYSYRDVREAYDAMVPEVSKALAVVHVPFLALALMLMFWRKQRYYADHFIVALHLVAFYMATILVFGYGIALLHRLVPPADWHNDLLNWTVRIVLTAYVLITLRRAYVTRWTWSAAATAGLLAAYVIVNLYLYRPVLFLSVFALT